jgi:hypothetical protein
MNGIESFLGGYKLSKNDGYNMSHQYAQELYIIYIIMSLGPKIVIG